MGRCGLRLHVASVEPTSRPWVNDSDGDAAWDAAAGDHDVTDSHVQWAVEVRCDLAGDGVVRAVDDGDPGPAALRFPPRLLWV